MVPTDADYSSVFVAGNRVEGVSWLEWVFWQWRVSTITVDWSITGEFPGFVGFPGPYTQSGSISFKKGYLFTVDPLNPDGVYQNGVSFGTETEYALTLGTWYENKSRGLDVSKLWQGWQGAHGVTDGVSTGSMDVIWCKYNRNLDPRTMTVGSRLLTGATIASPGGWGGSFSVDDQGEDSYETDAVMTMTGIDRRADVTYERELPLLGTKSLLYGDSVLLSGFINVTATAFYEWSDSEGQPLYNLTTGAPIVQAG